MTEDTTKEKNNQAAKKTKPVPQSQAGTSPPLPPEPEEKPKKATSAPVSPEITPEPMAGEVNEILPKKEPAEKTPFKEEPPVEKAAETIVKPVQEIKAETTGVSMDIEKKTEGKMASEEVAPTTTPEKEVSPEQKTIEPPTPPSPTKPVEKQEKENLGKAEKKEPLIIAPESAKPLVKPILGFLDKLKELRTKANQARTEKKEDNLKKILAYAREHNRITNDEVEKITGVRDDQATEYLNILVKQGKLVRFGKTKNTFYMPIKK